MRKVGLFWTTGLTVAAILVGGGRAFAQVPSGSQQMYDDALTNGWDNWSWTSADFNNSAKFKTGSRSIKVDAAPNTAVYLHHEAQKTGDYKSLHFWINGGSGASSGGQKLWVQGVRSGTAQTAVQLPPLAADTWQSIDIPLGNLGLANVSDFDGIWIRNPSGSTLPSFWVDDIALAAEPPPAVIPLNVDSGVAFRRIDSRVYGTNTAAWDQHFKDAGTGTFLSAMDVKSMRFPGGSQGDAYDWQTGRQVDHSWQWPNTFPLFAKTVKARGAQAYIIANYGTGTPEQAAAWVAYANGSVSNNTVIGVDSMGRDWKTVSYWAGLRAAQPLATDDGYNFLRIGQSGAFGFKYWEIGNECYGDWEYDYHGNPGSGLTGSKYDGVTYANYFPQFAAKMHAVDPTVKLGAVVNLDPSTYGNWTNKMLARLKALNTVPDFVIYHDYAQEPGHESDSFLMRASNRFEAQTASLRQYLVNYFGTDAGGKIELTITELNSVSYNPGKQTTSLVSGLYMADAFASLAKTDYKAVMWWALRNGTAYNNNSGSLYGWRNFGDYGVVASGDGPIPADTTYPTYYAGKLLAKWGRGGDKIVQATTGHWLLTVHAARLSNGQLALLVINKDPNADHIGQINLANFVPSGAQAWQYGKPQDTNQTDIITPAVGSFTNGAQINFPAYSITVLRLTGTGTTPEPPADPNPVPTPEPTPDPTPDPTPTPNPTPDPTPTPNPTPDPTPVPGNGFSVTYKIENDWKTGYTATVTIKNTGTAPIVGWNLGWNFAGNEKITQIWNGTLTQSGKTVSVKDAGWNATIAAGGSVSFGFGVDYSGTNTPPAAFTVNGASTGGGTTPNPSPDPNPPTTSYEVTYNVDNDWGNGFQATVTVKNTGNTPLSGWKVAWTYTGNQTINSIWNGTLTQSGKSVSVSDAGWNKTVPAGGTASFGFIGSYTGTNMKPTSFTVNGTAAMVK